MALTSTPPINLSDIQTEASAASLVGASNAAGFVLPTNMTEFYGWSNIPISTSGMHAYYPFNYPSLNDVSGNGRHGWHETGLGWNSGKAGGLCPNFTGTTGTSSVPATGQLIGLPNFGIFTGSTSFSIAFWLKVHRFPPIGVSWLYADSVFGFWREATLWATFADGLASNQLGLRMSWNGSWSTRARTNVLALDTWYHIAWLYSHSSTNGFTGFRSYQNGTLVYSLSGTGSIRQYTFGSEQLNSIGGVDPSNSDTYPNRYFAGQVDEFYIMNRVLTISEISILSSI